MSACFNGVVKFIDAKSGREVRTLTVGAGPDSVFFDAKRRVAFVPSGLAGSVIAVLADDRAGLAAPHPRVLEPIHDR
jgi:hypothetical protein